MLTLVQYQAFAGLHLNNYHYLGDKLHSKEAKRLTNVKNYGPLLMMFHPRQN